MKKFLCAVMLTAMCTVFAFGDGIMGVSRNCPENTTCVVDPNPPVDPNNPTDPNPPTAARQDTDPHDGFDFSDLLEFFF